MQDPVPMTKLRSCLTAELAVSRAAGGPGRERVCVCGLGHLRGSGADRARRSWGARFERTTLTASAQLVHTQHGFCSEPGRLRSWEHWFPAQASA